MSTTSTVGGEGENAVAQPRETPDVAGGDAVVDRGHGFRLRGDEAAVNGPADGMARIPQRRDERVTPRDAVQRFQFAAFRFIGDNHATRSTTG